MTAETGSAPLVTFEELSRLREIEHLAWHLMDDSEENGGTGQVTITPMREDYDKLAALLPEDHPPEWLPSPLSSTAPAERISFDDWWNKQEYGLPFFYACREAWQTALAEGKRRERTGDDPLGKYLSATLRKFTQGETMNHEQIARVAHEINRAYCQALGDNSQPKWEEAPEWQRTSAVNGVQFHVANPDAGPDHSHVEWLKEKEATGWKYGPVKNPDTKEHPCFVPYEQLPAEQKAKDYLFRAVVHALA